MDKSVNATVINLYHVCKREMWLHANGIRMEHTSEIVATGKLIHETTYPQRAEKYTELDIGGSKIDFYDAKNKVIHEIKKSDKMKQAHEWQVKYYILLLEENGIADVKGILEYPKLRETKEVLLEESDKIYLLAVKQQINEIIISDKCPPTINSSICKKCSYYDFCYVGE
jgi:CRISPR-associated exonuclease Cas4